MYIPVCKLTSHKVSVGYRLHVCVGFYIASTTFTCPCGIWHPWKGTFGQVCTSWDFFFFQWLLSWLFKEFSVTSLKLETFCWCFDCCRQSTNDENVSTLQPYLTCNNPLGEEYPLCNYIWWRSVSCICTAEKGLWFEVLDLQLHSIVCSITPLLCCMAHSLTNSASFNGASPIKVADSVLGKVKLQR